MGTSSHFFLALRQTARMVVHKWTRTTVDIYRVRYLLLPYIISRPLALIAALI